MIARTRADLDRERGEREKRYRGAMAQGRRLEKDALLGGAYQAFRVALDNAADPAEAKQALDRVGEALNRAKQRELMVRHQRFHPWDDVWLLDDFEAAGEPRWKMAEWPNANKCEVATTAHRGSGQLRVTGQPGEQIKIAVWRGWEVQVEFTSRKYLAFDFENASKQPVEVAVAVWTDEYFESRLRSLPPGYRGPMCFPLEAKAFKAASSDWKYTASISKIVEAKYFFVVVYSKKPSVVFMDNFRALRKKLAPKLVR